MFKKSAVLILHFAPSLSFTLNLQSVFYTQSAFYPRSADCKPQSAFYTDQALQKRESSDKVAYPHTLISHIKNYRQ